MPVLAALAALAASAACPVQAQQQQSAAPAAADTGPLQEVVVSAQFREEKLQTTPLAITAFTAQNIEERGIQSTTDLASFVPNAVIQPLGAGWGATMAAFIRGIGLGDNILSFEPGVPIYIDDVYFGRSEGSILDLLDLQRVEVLRGPQGTLFGKNAIGGTIRLISQKPKGDGSGYLSVQGGSRNRFNVRGMADFAIVPDKLLARVSFSSKKQDGYFYVVDYVCEHGPGSAGLFKSQVQPDEGCITDTLGNENVQSGRLALRYLAAPGLEVNVIGDMTIQRQKGPADKYTIIDPNGFKAGPVSLNALWNSVVAVPTFGVPWDQRFLTSSPYTNYSTYGIDPLIGRNVPNINDMDQWGISGTVDWDIADTVHLKSVSAYRRYWNKFGRDSDGSPLPMNPTFDDNRHRQFTEELELTGRVSILDWTVGGFFYDAFDENRGFDSLLPGIVYAIDIHDQQTTKDYAAFVHGVFHVTEKLSVTAGLRYTKDKKDATIFRSAILTGAVIIPPTTVAPEASRVDKSLNVSYQWTPDFMTYALYSTGFRGGGFSPRPNNALQVRAFGPEFLENFEIGEKSELFDRRIRLNADVFYENYTNQQQFEQIFLGGSVCFCEINTGKSRLWGVEAEVQAEPIERFQIQASLGYLNFRLQDRGLSTLCSAPGGGPLPQSDPCWEITQPRAPKTTAAVGLQYGIPLPGGSTITPRLDTTYQSTMYFTTNGDGVQPGYTLFNGHLTWQSPKRAWQVELYSMNLGDKVYFNGKLALGSLLGREQGNVAPPRETGIILQRNFD